MNISDNLEVIELGGLYNVMLSDKGNIKDNMGAFLFRMTSLDTGIVSYGIKANDTLIFLLKRDAKNIYEMLKKEFEVE